MNDEIRMTNDKINPNDQNSKLGTRCFNTRIRHSSFVIRHSGFVILTMPDDSAPSSCHKSA